MAEKMTAETKHIVTDRDDLELYMQCELNAVCDGFNYFNEVLFGCLTPGDNYTNEYKQLQSMFYLLCNSLNSFAGKFNLLTGEDETGQLQSEREQIEMLHAICNGRNQK